MRIANCLSQNIALQYSCMRAYYKEKNYRKFPYSYQNCITFALRVDCWNVYLNDNDKYMMISLKTLSQSHQRLFFHFSEWNEKRLVTVGTLLLLLFLLLLLLGQVHWLSTSNYDIQIGHSLFYAWFLDIISQYLYQCRFLIQQWIESIPMKPYNSEWFILYYGRIKRNSHTIVWLSEEEQDKNGEQLNVYRFFFTWLVYILV